jgi:lysophospholipase L1-like esterase
MKIAIIGDSISTKEEMKTLTEDFLTRMGNPGTVDLYAVAGENTDELMHRLSAIPLDYDYYYVFFGANDASINHGVELPGYRHNLSVVVQRFGHERVSLLTVPYVNEAIQAPNRTNERVGQYTQVVKEVAEATGANCVDLNHAMTVYPGSNEFVVEDGLHFTHEGYELVTSLIAVDVKNRKLLGK